MFEELLKTLAVTTLAGTAFAGVLVLAKPITRRVFGAAWHYYIWLAVLAVMILPVRFSIPISVDRGAVTNAVVQEVYTAPTSVTAVAPVQEAGVSAAQSAVRGSSAAAASLAQHGADVLFAVWILGAVLSLLVSVIGYLRLVCAVRKMPAVDLPEIGRYTKRKVIVRAGGVSPPFIMGIFHPVLVLPEREFSAEELDNILRHEMVHLRRGDILYKHFAVLVRCVHWFNPVVYYAVRQIGAECEISCDMAAVKGMDEGERRGYMRTILALLTAGGAKNNALTTGMACGKKTLKKRFVMIKNAKRTSRIAAAVSVIAAAVVFGATVFASGALAGFVIDNYSVDIIIGVDTVEFENKAFIENNEVYFPLRETLDVLGISEREGSFTDWDDGDIFVFIASDDGSPNVEFDIHINETNVEYWLYSGETVYNEEKLSRAPIIKDSVAYIPYELVNTMFNERNDLAVGYMVRDAFGNDITLDFIKELPRRICSFEIARYVHDYSQEQQQCAETVQALFNLWQRGDIQGMSAYCTSDFAQGELADGAILGYGRAAMGTIYSVNLYGDGNYRVDASFYPYSNRNDEHTLSVTVGVINGAALVMGVDEVEVVHNDAEQDINAALAVVNNYFSAVNARDKEAVLATVTAWASEPNVVLWQDENIDVTRIYYDPARSLTDKNLYLKSGRGAENGTLTENVIVVYADFTVTDDDNTSPSENTGMKFILIRGGENDEWRIDDMGY